ncbi:hypothetical protein M422DRAFT_191935, partial [Sphaerobolus stellatus SS14]
LGYPPTQWTEVFSRADGKWLPVDPVRNFVNMKKIFEPPPHDKRNRMVYVLAFEEDGYARDVTQRYVREFTNKAAKVRGGRGQKEWWERVMRILARPYRLHRDDIEDAELVSRQMIEGMPTSVAAFKDHPIYVLERHILRDEVLHPRVEIGRFRGEPVFARENVISGLKTAENWMRSGRVVKEGEQALKMVKVRATTISKKRAIGMAGETASGTVEGDSEAMQGMYTFNQTELYRPPPVVNGKVPKNDFGNIDLYVDSMLPAGAVYIPHKGAAKIARELGFDYAEAVTGFEFKNRRAFPIINGIVVAMENEAAVTEAYLESAQAAEEKERIKKEERVLKRWTRLIHGLRIRKRLQEQYAGDPSTEEVHHGVDNREPEAGGFLLETADNVVEAYSLPKPVHIMDPSSSKQVTAGEEDKDMQPFDNEAFHRFTSGILEEENVDEDMEEVQPALPVRGLTTGVPKTMQELAEAPDAFMATAEPEQPLPPPQAAAPPPTKIAASKQKGGRKTRQTNGNKAAPKAKPTQIRSTRRGKKRARSPSSEEEAELEGDDGDDDGDGKNTPKRSRGKVVPTPAPSTSTRTLRARKPKPEEIIRQERELELAFRKAIAK